MPAPSPKLSVAAPQDGPCSAWATVDDCAAYSFIDPQSVDTDLLTLYLDIASRVLFVKSGRQYPGQCTTKIRPVARTWAWGQPQSWWESWGYPYIPEINDGLWFNLGPFFGPGAMPSSTLIWDPGGQQIPTINLGQYPVTDIMSVLIDGVEADPAIYRLDYWRDLTRIDGNFWPLGQDLLKPDTQAGTFSITFRHGTPVPPEGVMAAAQLATELTRESDPKAQNKLSMRATGLSRQGVTYSLADVTKIVDGGGVGLFAVDLFLNTANPNKLPGSPRVLTPDIIPHRRLGSQ